MKSLQQIDNYVTSCYEKAAIRSYDKSLFHALF